MITLYTIITLYTNITLYSNKYIQRLHYIVIHIYNNYSTTGGVNVLA